MKILIVTDTWNNTNGVVTYLTNIKTQLEKRGWTVSVIHPGQFKNFPLFTYPEIKLGITTRSRMEKIIKDFDPDYIHISTEGPMGFAARGACIKNGLPFSTYYHTRLPEYIHMRLGSLIGSTYRYLRWFHRASYHVMVSTSAMKTELESKGFKNVHVSHYAVDTEMFCPTNEPPVEELQNLPRPIFAFMGRVAPEKNLEKFLDCDLPGTKLVIGDGPSRISLQNKYGAVAKFVGYKKNKELVRYLSAVDVSVFPSIEDTFGIAIIEALACGVPVAAYDARGPREIITNGYDGYIGDNLRENAIKCLKINKLNCIETAQKYSWNQSVDEFIQNQIIISRPSGSSMQSSDVQLPKNQL